MLRNKSFNFRAKFGAIYSASETKEVCVLKNIPIDNRILVFTAEFWTNFSYGVGLQQLLRNFSGIYFIISIKADTSISSQKCQQYFLRDAILFKLSRVYLSANFAKNILFIAQWYMFFSAKFRSHRIKNEKVMTKISSTGNNFISSYMLLPDLKTEQHTKSKTDDKDRSCAGATV